MPLIGTYAGQDRPWATVHSDIDGEVENYIFEGYVENVGRNFFEARET